MLSCSFFSTPPLLLLLPEKCEHLADASCQARRRSCPGSYPPHLQVYEHHCKRKLPDDAQRLRSAATYIVANQEAVQWGLEICGFHDVQV